MIGTNKTCAQETVARMIEDIGLGKVNIPEDPSSRELEDLIYGIGSAVVTYPVGKYRPVRIAKGRGSRPAQGEIH